MAPERSPGDATHHTYVANGAKWRRIMRIKHRAKEFQFSSLSYCLGRHDYISLVIVSPKE
jgi:hypothetical protein